MTVRCGKCGAESAAADYCDECGSVIHSTVTDPKVDPATPVAASPAGSLARSAGTAVVPTPECPSCQSEREPSDLFCEICGFDFISGKPATAPSPRAVFLSGAERGNVVAKVAWELGIEIDEIRWLKHADLRVDAGRPPDPSTIPLVTAKALIGRASRSRRISPDVDLGSLTGDPAVSHRHAELLLSDAGSWVIADLGSDNGTMVNGVALEANSPVPIASGDRIELGAWSTILVRSR